jgi:hypothetical protein
MAQVTLALMIMNRRNHQKMICFFRSNLWMSKLGGIIVKFKLDNKSFYNTMTPPPLSLSSYVSCLMTLIIHFIHQVVVCKLAFSNQRRDVSKREITILYFYQLVRQIICWFSSMPGELTTLVVL